MKNIKLLHTSDIHLEWLFSKFSPQAKMARRRELLRNLEKIVDVALDREVQGLVIAGDLFHRPLVDRHILAAVGLAFTRLNDKNIKVLLLPGNHDPLVDKSLYRGADFPGNVHVFRSRDWEEYTEIDCLTVYALPFWEDWAKERVLSRLRRGTNDGFHVALLHGTFQMLANFPEQYYPFTSEDVAASGMDYIALGHYHNFLDCSAGDVRCCYPGAPHPLSFNNLAPRVLLEVTLDDAGVRVTPLPVENRPYRQYCLDVTGLSLREIYHKIEQWADPETCAKIVFNGIVRELADLEAAKIADGPGRNFFHLEVEDNTIISPEADNLTVKGLFVRKIHDRLAREGITGKERDILLMAMRAGLTALEGRKE